MSELRMPAVNQITVAGRLVQDPEFRLTEIGVARLSGLTCRQSLLPRSRGRLTGGGLVLQFRRLASTDGTSCRSVGQGIPDGRLHGHSWRDEDENPHSLVEIQVRHLQVLSRSVAADTPELVGESNTEMDEADTEVFELAA